VTTLLDRGWRVLVETSGHVPLDGLDARAVAIVDVKTPRSGESARMHWANLDRLRPQDEVKFVIADREDYEWSRALLRERAWTEGRTVLFSPVHDVLAPGELARWILEDGLPARVQVQLHKYLWPGAERGI
jgi:7-carboxy-7-deazaguanine synthase